MAEWTIAAVLKTAGRKPRGFESLSLRKKVTLPFLFSDSIISMSGTLRLQAGACEQG